MAGSQFDNRRRRLCRGVRAQNAINLSIFVSKIKSSVKIKPNNSVVTKTLGVFVR